jgi:alkylhydroperoxidase/carboxymuconolactone decarboxylase family protein YurZ
MMLNRDQKTPKPTSIFELCNAFEDQKTKQREAARSEGRPTAGFFKTSPNDVQQRLKLNESAILQPKRRLFSSLGCLITVRRQLFLKAHRSAAAARGSNNNNSSELVAVLMRGFEGEGTPRIKS